MTLFQKIILVLCVLLWLGLSYLMLDRGGVTLYNILVAALAGGLIIIPLYKKFKNGRNE